jgi:hypothetical protein
MKTLNNGNLMPKVDYFCENFYWIMT